MANEKHEIHLTLTDYELDALEMACMHEIDTLENRETDNDEIIDDIKKRVAALIEVTECLPVPFDIQEPEPGDDFIPL